MAAENDDPDGGVAEETAQVQAETQSKTVWNDANMQRVYANAANVTRGRDEIALLFGKNQPWQAGDKEIKIELSDRIVLSPFVAEQLSILLNNMIQEYEREFGKLNIESGPEGTMGAVGE